MTDLIFPPADHKAEREMLGRMVQAGGDSDGGRWLIEQIRATGLTAGDLDDPRHRALYLVVESIIEAGRPWDGRLLLEALDERGQLTAQRDREYLVEVIECAGAPAAAPRYAQKIRTLAVKRSVVQQAHTIQSRAANGTDLSDLHQSASELYRTIIAATANSDTPTPTRWRRYPVDALPDPLEGIVNDYGAALDVDGCFVAIPMLAMLASCIGATRRVRLKRTWHEPAILWTALIAESGTKKTPAMQAVLAPLRDAQRARFAEHDAAMEQHEQDVAEYERNLATWRRNKSAANDPPVKPDPPTCPRHIVSDATTEALAGVLQENPRGVLLGRDELAGWLGDLDRYAATKGGDGPRWLSIWSCDPITIDRKSNGTTYIHRPVVSITGGIQPGVLRRVLGTEHLENGMAARMLLAMPPRRRNTWTDADLREETEQRLARIVTHLLTLHPDTDTEGHTQPVSIRLDDEAHAAYTAWHDAHADEQAEASGPLASAMAKMPAYVARMALVLHYARWADGQPVSETIDGQSMDAAIALIEWHKREARRVYGMFVEDEIESEHRELIDWIEGRGGSVTARDLMHHKRKYRGNAADAEAALQALVDAGYGNWKQPPQEGRGKPPARRFVLGGDSGHGNQNSDGDAASGNMVTVTGLPGCADGQGAEA